MQYLTFDESGLTPFQVSTVRSLYSAHRMAQQALMAASNGGDTTTTADAWQVLLDVMNTHFPGREFRYHTKQ